MTKLEKVIKGLECCTSDVSCAECLYRGKRDGALNCVRELSADALELLKEQKPIKPTLAVDTWICSNCGHRLESQTLIDDKENPQVLINEQYDFCPQCGKAVKWNDEA